MIKPCSDTTFISRIMVCKNYYPPDPHIMRGVAHLLLEPASESRPRRGAAPLRPISPKCQPHLELSSRAQPRDPLFPFSFSPRTPAGSPTRNGQPRALAFLNAR